MEQCHVNALRTFGEAVHLIGGQNKVKVLTILLLLQFPDRSCFQPGVVTAAGYPCDLA